MTIQGHGKNGLGRAHKDAFINIYTPPGGAVVQTTQLTQEELCQMRKELPSRPKLKRLRPACKAY